MVLKRIRSYSELMQFQTLEERYQYLRLSGDVGKETFGYERYLNQKFYQSQEWKSFRNQIIIRDNGCDLGVEGYEIYGRIYIHHINPISPIDLKDGTDLLMDPENSICTTFDTHQAIHYGDENLLMVVPKERTKNDTCPWKI